MINISELIEDPDFCQPGGISITRATITIQNHVPIENKFKVRVPGIVTISSENTDDMRPESDRNSEAIHVFTYQRLKTVGIDKLDGKTYAADIIHYNGADYIVRYCLDDAQYGFCRSTAVKIEQNTM